MKIKENFVLRQVGDSSIVVAVGEETKNFNAMIKLNSTGVFLWKLLEKGATEEELLQKVLEKYAFLLYYIYDMQKCRNISCSTQFAFADNFHNLKGNTASQYPMLLYRTVW